MVTDIKECAHDYVYGKCKKCGERCEHRSWVNGWCEGCGIDISILRDIGRLIEIDEEL